MSTILFRPHVPGFFEVNDEDRKEREFDTGAEFLNDPLLTRRVTGGFTGFSLGENPPELFDGTPSSMLMAHYDNDEYYVVGYIIGDISEVPLVKDDGAPTWSTVPFPSYEEVTKTKTAQPFNPYWAKAKPE